MNTFQTEPPYDPARETAKGKECAIRVMDDRSDAGAAFLHPVLGHISLLYGDRNVGIRHILYRREREIADDAALAGQVPAEVVLKLIEVIIHGKLQRTGGKCIVEHESFRAVLAAPSGDQLNYWLLTGYKLSKK
jgi:hypothetical protein